jgi:flagellar hook-associated protein 3 FlgL
MRISSVQIQQTALNAMLDQQAKLSKTQNQVAAGLKVLSPADDPIAAVAILEHTQQLARITQYQRNIDRTAASLSTEETALGSMQDQLQQLRELAVRGSGSLGAAGRLAISYEVRQLQNSMLDTVNTRDATGEYLFSGFQSQVQPYTAAGGGVFTYNGDQGQRLIEVSPSTRIAASDPGARIFGALPAAAGGFTDVFKIIDNLATNLENNTFSGTTIADLDTARTSVVGARASVGARQNTLTSIQDLNSSFGLDTQKTLSAVQDLDYAEATSRLNQQLVALQAAQQTFVKIQNLSLFNFLR